jgi:hypothetical protein
MGRYFSGFDDHGIDFRDHEYEQSSALLALFRGSFMNNFINFVHEIVSKAA